MRTKNPCPIVTAKIKVTSISREKLNCLYQQTKTKQVWWRVTSKTCASWKWLTPAKNTINFSIESLTAKHIHAELGKTFSFTAVTLKKMATITLIYPNGDNTVMRKMLHGSSNAKSDRKFVIFEFTSCKLKTSRLLTLLSLGFDSIHSFFKTQTTAS